ncbi:helix-turn-helix domain-containing protein [Microbacterium sp. NPDC080220]|uniref:helix-turn-helix domain-containing protein n=1 Tax=Microbacterium sp. NPDC080220 TaxID=3161017 RepID=UPI00341A81BF
MSVKVSSWVWHGDETAGLSGNEMILMLALADVADDNGRCRYLADEDDLSYGGLARKVRVDRRTIERLIPKLRLQGLLGMKRGSKTTPNEFRLVVPWAKTTTDKVSGNDSDAPTAVQDSPTAVHAFTDTSGDRSSYQRIDVRDVSTSDVASDAAAPYSSEVIDLCEKLAAAVRANGHKVGTVGQLWWAACDRLIRLDGYSVEQVEWMIRWATTDEFWAANIRSMPKLREKFSTLVAQAKRKAGQAPVDRARATLDLGARLQAQADAAARGVAS